VNEPKNHGFKTHRDQIKEVPIEEDVSSPVKVMTLPDYEDSAMKL
jgi:hypothetical protein